jgi:flagellar basal body-associated protein FliL
MKTKLNKTQIISLTILIIMVLSTIGFSIVSFYSDREEQQQIKEIKPCINSSDCILICGMEPYFINCTKNMCDETECPTG